MSVIEYGADVNLEDLRCQLTSRVALLLIGASGSLMCFLLPRDPFSVVSFAMLTVVFVLSSSVRALVGARPILARHLLVWGLTGVLLAAMGVFTAPWLPFLGLTLAFPSAMLIAGSGFATAGAIAALAAWLVYSGTRLYPFPQLLIALALGVALAWMVVRTLYTALEWAWTMQQRADHLLEVTRDRQGELSRALKSLDLTNMLLRRTQRELVVARRQAEEARIMKEQFAANISHELRTPLNLILGFSEMIYLSPEVYGEIQWSSKLRRAVHHIYHSSRHLSEMIDDILDLSRLEMVGFKLDKALVQLEPLLREAVEIADALFRKESVRLEVEIPQDLPALEVDRTRIRQVLLNLLNNAARFTEEGTVRLSARRTEDEVVISVSDTGVGISVDKLPHVFDEFYQVDRSLHRRHGGAGLGLAISKHFVEAHDGRIWVESEEGVGSSFAFALPIPGKRVPLSHLEVDRPPEPSWPEIRPLILVVDSDPTVATLIDRHVEECDVIQVEDASRLEEEVTLHHPRVVVCNVPPGKRVDYDDLISIPVPFFQCSLPSQGWVADDLAVTACLTKPVTADQLLGAVERVDGVRDVLVVDDERGFCQLVQQMLEASGRFFEVRHAYDGREGLQAMSVQRPDLVFLDLIMPGVDGFQVIEEMRDRPELANVPVMLLTATSYVEDALSRRGSQVVIHRPDGLGPVETLQCLRVVIDVLKPRYDERSAPAQALGTHVNIDV
jgi:signal transduction histidine kinase/CheY-like chemotaxis protein